MKKIISLISLLFVLCGLIVIFNQFETQRVPNWRQELNNYLIEDRLQQGGARVQRVVEASQPWNYLNTMGKPVPRGWVWGIETVPFPPTAMQCVLLAEGEINQQVIYVGYHTDNLWRVGWLVHEGPTSPFQPEHIVNLTEIGCDLGLKGG